MRCFCLILLFSVTIAFDALGQQREPVPGGHMVIMVNQEKIYTDVGQRDGLVRGDVIEVFRRMQGFAHPQTGEVLGGYPLVIGKLKITQVFEKYSIGKVVKWSSPEQIRPKDRIWIPKGKTAGVSGNTSRWHLLIPGLYQFTHGLEGRGIFFVGGVLGLAGSGTYFKLKSRSVHRDYLALPAGAAQDEFNAFYDRYRSNGRRGDILLMAAGGLYLANILDGLVRRPGADAFRSQRWLTEIRRDQLMVHFAF